QGATGLGPAGGPAPDCARGRAGFTRLQRRRRGRPHRARRPVRHLRCSACGRGCRRLDFRLGGGDMMRFSMGLAAASILMLSGAAWAQEETPVATAASVVAASDWRAVPAENLLVIDTNKGRVLVELAPEVAPG